jgi:hypothetical protein
MPPDLLSRVVFWSNLRMSKGNEEVLLKAGFIMMFGVE